MKVFRKNEITFAVLLIVVYVVGMSMMQRVSEHIGTEYTGEMIFAAVMSAAVFIFAKKNDLTGYIGLRKPDVPASKMLFYIPLILIGGGAVFFGVGTEYSVPVLIFHTVTMIFVGFLEEVIFRGFLFRGIAKNDLKRGIIISSVTFAAGHFVNLLNGSDLTENVLQVIYALAVGFMLVFIFLRTGSIIPCIAFHSFNNCMTAFSSGDILISRFGETTGTIIMLAIQLVIATAYLIYVTKLPRRELTALNAPQE